MKSDKIRYKSVGIDIDNTIADTFVEVLKRFNAIFSTKIKYEHLHDWNYFYKYTDIEKVRIDKFFDDFFSNPMHVINVKPILHSNNIIKNIRNSGSKIVYITARPTIFEEKTKEWMKIYDFLDTADSLNHYPHLDFSVSDAQYKIQRAKENNVEIMIEDSLDIALAFDIPVLLFDQPWNKANKLPAHITRVKTWIEIKSLLKF